MAGPLRVSDGDESPGETAQPSEIMTPQEKLEWQAELDSAFGALDSRLSHPRRRATDLGTQPTLPELGHVEITSELLDEIAWRVAEQLRQSAAARAEASGSPAVPADRSARSAVPARLPAPAPVSVASGMRPGTVMMIRFRWPLRLPWPFRLLQRRRRLHPLTTSR